jgi:hypothetical protein
VELLILVALGAVGVVLIRSRVAAAEPTVPTPAQNTEPASGSVLPVDLDFGPLDPLVEEYIIEPVAGIFLAGIEAGKTREAWEENVQSVLDRGSCDDVIRAGADRAAVMVKIISILGVPPGEWKGTPGMTWGTRVSIEDRIAFVLREPLPEDVPYLPPVEGVEVVVTGVGVIAGPGVVALEPGVVWEPEPMPEDDRAAQLEALAEVARDAFDFPDLGWGLW